MLNYKGPAPRGHRRPPTHSAVSRKTRRWHFAPSLNYRGLFTAGAGYILCSGAAHCPGSAGTHCPFRGRTRVLTSVRFAVNNRSGGDGVAGGGGQGARQAGRRAGRGADGRCGFPEHSPRGLGRPGEGAPSAGRRWRGNKYLAGSTRQPPAAMPRQTASACAQKSTQRGQRRARDCFAERASPKRRVAANPNGVATRTRIRGTEWPAGCHPPP